MITTRPPTRQLKAAYSLLYLLAVNRRGVRHSGSKGDYVWNANGRPVSDAQIQRQLDKLNDAYHKNVTRLAERLDSGNLTIPQWQERMRKEVKDVHRTNYIIGRGGVDKMTPRDWGRLGSDLRWMQYNKLDGFALDIANGKRLPDGTFRPYSEAEIKARSRLYVNASNKQYWRGKTEAKMAAGFVEKERFLNPAEHCDDCERFAAMGRRPIDDPELPPPGEDSECQANCKCTMDYYKAGGIPQVEPPMPEPPPRRQLERDRFRRFEGPTSSDKAEKEVWDWASKQSYEAWNDNLSDREREWLQSYKDADFSWLNSKLRTGDNGLSKSDLEWLRSYKGLDGYPTDKDFRSAKRIIDKAIDSHPGLTDEVTLWRGGSHPEITKALESGRDIDDLVGMVIEDKAYLSTSIDEGNTGYFMEESGKQGLKFEIQAPSGTKGAFIEYIDNSLQEYEFLLPRGTKMEIIEARIVDGVRHIVARVLV